MVGKSLTWRNYPKRTPEVQPSVWGKVCKGHSKYRCESGQGLPWHLWGEGELHQWGLSWLFSLSRGSRDCDLGYPSTGNRILPTYVGFRSSPWSWFWTSDLFRAQRPRLVAEPTWRDEGWREGWPHASVDRQGEMWEVKWEWLGLRRDWQKHWLTGQKELVTGVFGITRASFLSVEGLSPTFPFFISLSELFDKCL